MSNYNHLNDEDKLALAIKFVAINQPLPAVLELFLKEQGLYEMIVQANVETKND